MMSILLHIGGRPNDRGGDSGPLIDFGIDDLPSSIAILGALILALGIEYILRHWGFRRQAKKENEISRWLDSLEKIRLERIEGTQEYRFKLERRDLREVLSFIRKKRSSSRRVALWWGGILGLTLKILWDVLKSYYSK